MKTPEILRSFVEAAPTRRVRLGSKEESNDNYVSGSPRLGVDCPVLDRPCSGLGFLERSAMMTEFVEISVNFKALGISIDGEIDKKSGAKILDILLWAETRKGKIMTELEEAMLDSETRCPDLCPSSVIREAARSYAALQKLAPEIGKLVEAGEKCRSYKLHKDPNHKDYEDIEIGEFECPMCDGQGTVDGEQHVNVRGEVSAMNVLFSGIGQDMVDWAEFHKTAIEARPILKAIYDNLTAFGKDTRHD